jgi:hypothetical protein
MVEVQQGHSSRTGFGGTWNHTGRDRPLSGAEVKRIVWTDPAKADVRSLSMPTAMHILSAPHRFA